MALAAACIARGRGRWEGALLQCTAALSDAQGPSGSTGRGAPCLSSAWMRDELALRLQLTAAKCRGALVGCAAASVHVLLAASSALTQRRMPVRDIRVAWLTTWPLRHDRPQQSFPVAR